MSKFIVSVGLVVVLIVQSTSGQSNTCRGTPPNVITPAHFFETDRMMGTWYLHTSWANDPNRPQVRCHSMDLERGQGPKQILAYEKVFNETIGDYLGENSELTIDSTLPLESIWGSFVDGEKMTDVVWVQTTYEDWALSYGCRQRDSLEYLVLWLRNSDRVLEPKTFEILKVIAKGYGFPPEFIEDIDNTHCP